MTGKLESFLLFEGFPGGGGGGGLDGRFEFRLEFEAEEKIFTDNSTGL